MFTRSLKYLFLAKGTKVIVFVEFKKTADFLAALLSDSELSSTSIHGDRFQEQREAALKEFRIGKRDILVATNVAARGLGTIIQVVPFSPS
jgi:probable ATP-dependent RNA helicase DDX4